MSRLSLFVFFIFSVGFVFSQTNDTIVVLDRDFTATKKTPIHFIYGVEKGDKLLIHLSTNKNKEIDRFTIVFNDKNALDKVNFVPSGIIEITVPQKSFVHFNFDGPTFGRDISFKLERIPASEETKYFNTALQLNKHYETKIKEYEEDSVVGYTEPEYRPNNFRVIEDVAYESRQMDVQTHTVRAGGTKGVIAVKPESNIKEPNKDLKFLGYQVVITSALTGEKVWKYISAGVDVGTLALSLALPVVGTVGGLAVNTAFEMIGPQKGGEPIYYSILPNQTELDNFQNNRQTLTYGTGLATGYSATWPPYDTIAIGLKNLNTTTDVKAVVAIYAIYQAITYQDINQNTAIIRPRVYTLKKKREVTENIKTWAFQN